MHRIDSSTNSIVAPPIRDELPLLGGTAIPPVLAAGEEAAWTISPTAAHPRLALRVNADTNQVAREQLRVDRFYPAAVEDDAVWFIGSAGRRSTLGRLDARTGRQTHATELPISAARAVMDSSTDTFWIASLVTRGSERPRVIRVQTR